MNRTRIIFFVIIGAAIFMASWVLKSNVPTAPNAEAEADASPQTATNVVHISIASSSTKQSWMSQVVTDFHASGATLATGQTIRVHVNPVSSGGSTQALLNGTLKPVVWSPGVSSWIQQLNSQIDKPIISEACRASIYTPLGIAMWRPMAEALGWPDNPVGWQTLVDLAADEQGWGRYDHAEWGQFRLGHAHPAYSNSGLLTMTAFIYGMAGKQQGLTAAEVYAAPIETALRSLAQNTAKYGKVTENLINLLVKEGPNYLHAVATYESDAVRLNQQRADELRFPIAFIFPSEGVFWGDHPYCILDKADWVSPEQVQAAQLFQTFMLSTAAQKNAIDSLLRPLDSRIVLHAPLDLAHGTDPRITPESIAPLSIPDADLSAAVIDLFTQTKRKATIMLTLDVSGSMKGEKIRTATKATANFLRRLHPDDEVGVILFSRQVRFLSPPKRVSEVIETLPSRIETVLARGDTALHQAVCESVDYLNKLREEDLAAGENRLYGIALLSDGDDTVGTPSENKMFATCLPNHAEADGIKIFPIAFGEGANTKVLKRIADVTAGNLFIAKPESIEAIYVKISAEQ